MINRNIYNPDVLLTLANLSSDEVFTSPDVANKLLDLLPKELWSNKEAKFLDPVSKSGVFLREITKRLINGLKEQIPNLQEKIDHILLNQVFGISITEITHLISCRTLYYSKEANGKYSVTNSLKNTHGNVYFPKTEHSWSGSKCIYCGASKSKYKRTRELESHAYSFIHENIPKELNMKFDVIIGNPPYQLSDGGAQASAMPLYHKFVEQAKKLNPRYLSMIIPSRWFTDGKGLDQFKSDMINDKRIRVIHDFLNASDVFPGVEIKGGVLYFLWDRDNKGSCEITVYDKDQKIIDNSKRYLKDEVINSDVVLRHSKYEDILKKVRSKMEPSFSQIVSPMRPYGLRGDFFKNPSKYKLPKISKIPIEQGWAIIGLDDKFKRTKRYIPKNYPIPRNQNNILKWKIFTQRNVGTGEMGTYIPGILISKPGELCTETYIEIGPFDNYEIVENVSSYIRTKFFRMLVEIRKNTQSVNAEKFSFVPMQDFKIKWTDEQLYEKYNLNQEEIDFIEKNIKEMHEEMQLSEDEINE